MSLFSRFFSFFGDNATGQRQGSQLIEPVSIAHEETAQVGVDSALQVSTVWACVLLMVENLSSLPLRVYRTDKDGGRAIDNESLLYQVLRVSPNQHQTGQEFWQTMLLNYFMRGNAYAKLDRSARGEVVAMYPLSASQMEVIVAEDGSLMYVYRLDSEGIIYQSKDILHIKGMGNGIVGLSRLDYMRSSVNLAINSQNHTSKTYRKNARRPGILMTDDVLTEAQRKAVRENFGDITTGENQELFILEAQFKFQPLGMTPADLQLDKTRDYSVEDLCRWFGVPSVLVNDTKQTTSLGSSVQQIIEVFYRLNLRPKIESIEQALLKRVLTPRQRAQGYEAEFDLNAFLRASAGEQAEIDAKHVQNGLRTRNEIRTREGKRSMGGGDVLTVQSNLWPADKLGEQAGQVSAVPEEPIKQ